MNNNQLTKLTIQNHAIYFSENVDRIINTLIKSNKKKQITFNKKEENKPFKKATFTIGEGIKQLQEKDKSFKWYESSFKLH